MGECLQKACPRLARLCRRILSPDRRAADGGDADGAAGPPAGPPEPPRDCGPVYRALWAFQSRQGDELSFQDGDLFSVLSRGDDWWSVRRIDTDGRVLDSGMVPGNYLAPADSIQIHP